MVALLVVKNRFGRSRARLRAFCHHPRVRWLITVLTLTTLALQPACGPKGGTTGGGGGKLPAAVSAYGALRWVPADVSYAVVGKRAADVSALLRELAELAGIFIPDVDARAVSAISTQEFGYDILSPESLAGIGIDPEQGAAFFSTGVSVTAVAAIGDPSKLEAFVERMRDAGVSLQSQISDGAEVLTVAMGRDVSISWTVVDGWILARVELMEERAPELGWLISARAAAGGLGAHADFAAALDAARVHAPSISVGDGPPVVGVLRPSRLLDAGKAFIKQDGDPVAYEACFGPLRRASRVLVAAGVGSEGASGSAVAELDDPSGLASMIVPAAAGWYGVRAGAPLQIDLGLDLHAAIGSLRGCPMDADMLLAWGVRTVHAAAHSFDDWMPIKAAAFADLSSDRAIRAQLGRIPMLGRFSDKRKIGDVDVVDVSVPLVADATYHLSPTRMIVSMGGGVMEAILGAGTAPDDEIAHFELRPHEVPEEAWQQMLEQVLGVDRESARAHVIKQLRRWERGLIDVRLDGGRVVLTATGTYHR